ncbi:MAG TPA: peptidylprolyl isomerase [Planctomycetota bacterium]|mgnify:CR=1 FL=1|nr:peptidylprolyl isomerase [Planctomycetota bacterium]HRR81652.1 peptidylprolyl isomerase [Planctomycetota bacterium]HRT95408.1 peptidylprolyl isomerase [Planctomycetota bacterium]
MTRRALAALVWWLPLASLAAEAPKEKAPPETQPPKHERLAPGTYAHLRTAKGEIVFRLLDDKAPKTVANFVELARGERPWKAADGRWVAKPFYDGLTFHRIENDVLKLIQGGCPKGDGTGGPGYKFDDETDETLRFDRPGVVAMANSGPNTNGSQFFITLAPAPALDKRFTIFGEVVRGLDVAEAISQMPSEPRGSGANVTHVAKEPVVIQAVTIETVKDEGAPKGK